MDSDWDDLTLDLRSSRADGTYGSQLLPVHSVSSHFRKILPFESSSVEILLYCSYPVNAGTSSLPLVTSGKPRDHRPCRNVCCHPPDVSAPSQSSLADDVSRDDIGLISTETYMSYHWHTKGHLARIAPVLWKKYNHTVRHD